jgi:hypothetical protein
MAFLVVLAALAAAGSGCAAMKVQPWDRDLLAKETMRLAPSTIEAGADDHIYFSKEGSVGGLGVGGGGCGCN